MKKTSLYTIISVILLAFIIAVVAIKDATHNLNVFVQSELTTLKVYVTDLDGNAISGATVKVNSCSAYTNYTGFCPAIQVEYSSKEANEWFCVDVTVKCEGYTDTVLLGCVIYKEKSRVVQIRLYYDDGSIPYVVYHENPPEDYIKSLFK